MEWQEPGNPVNVVSANHVESGGVLKVGDLCSVKVKEVSRMVSYPAKILGMGKPNVCNWCCTSFT